MARRDRVYLPLGTGGLLRYHEEEEMLSIKPEHVIAFSIGFAIFIIFVKLFV